MCICDIAKIKENSMKYKAKVELINNFLKEKGFIWYKKSVFHNKYWLEATKATEEDFNKNSKVKVFLNEEEAYLCIDPVTFKIFNKRVVDYQEKMILKEDLTEDWIDFLLKNDVEFINYYNEYNEEEIKKLQEGINQLNLDYQNRMKELESKINKVRENKKKIKQYFIYH